MGMTILNVLSTFNHAIIQVTERFTLQWKVLKIASNHKANDYILLSCIHETYNSLLSQICSVPKNANNFWPFTKHLKTAKRSLIAILRKTARWYPVFYLALLHPCPRLVNETVGFSCTFDRHKWTSDNWVEYVKGH